MNYNSFPTKNNFCSLHDRRKRHGEIDIQEGSVLNKSGDDVYKQQMMDNFRFPSASIASSPSPIQQSNGFGDGILGLVKLT